MKRAEAYLGGRPWLALLVLFLFAFALRAIGFEQVIFDDRVLFAPGDAMYHLRRAFYTFANFPAPLVWDPLLNYPDGAPVPWAPLFDWGLGGVAWVLASDQWGFERVAAWISPVLGGLTVVPIFAIARRLASVRVAVVACVLYALIPISVNYARVGNPDHHSAVALVGAVLVWLSVVLVDPETDSRGALRLAPVLALARLAMMLIWHGNLLYLAVLDGALITVAIFSGRAGVLRAECWSAIGTAALLAPIVASLPLPTGGAYSSISLSRLHVMVVLSIAAVAGAVGWLDGRRRPSTLATRWLFAVGAGVVCLSIALAIPELRRGLEPALRFGSLRDGVGGVTAEQFPLFAVFGREVVFPAERAWARLHLLIPVVPVVFLAMGWRARGRNPAAWVLLVWSLVFGALAIVQRRYGNDLAPVACVAFAMLFVELPRFVVGWTVVPGERGRRGLERAAIGLGLAFAIYLLAPAITGVYGPRLRGSLEALTAEAPRARDPRAGATGSVIAFARRVRNAIPETGGFLNSSEVPEFGLLASANLGHVLHYVARKGTATDPMWHYIGPGNWKRSHLFLRASQEREALRLADRLRGRYVVTSGEHALPSVVARLHLRDGVGKPGVAPLVHFRLVTEADPGLPGLARVFGDRAEVEPDEIPYKLFEIVEGARIRVEARPASRVEAFVEVESPSGRRFVHRSIARSSASGLAELRVPYATESALPTKTRGPYRLRFEPRGSNGSEVTEVPVDVSEQAVLRGLWVDARKDVGTTLAPGRITGSRS